MMKMKTKRMKEWEEGLERKDAELDCTSLAVEHRKQDRINSPIKKIEEIYVKVVSMFNLLV